MSQVRLLPRSFSDQEAEIKRLNDELSLLRAQVKTPGQRYLEARNDLVNTLNHNEIWANVDTNQFRAQLRLLIQESDSEQSKLIAAGKDLTQLAKNTELAQKMLNNLTSSQLDINELHNDYKHLEKRVRKVEGTNGEQRRYYQRLSAFSAAAMMTGLLIVTACAISIALITPPAIIPLIITLPTLFSTVLARTGYHAAAAKEDDYAIKGLPRALLFFGDAVVDKANNAKPSLVERVRRSFR